MPFLGKEFESLLQVALNFEFEKQDVAWCSDIMFRISKKSKILTLKMVQKTGNPQDQSEHLI